MSDERDEFERHRNCAHCGQRLIHAQYDDDTSTVFTKRCPQFDPTNQRHDFLEHRHRYPYRDRQSRLSGGTKARIR
jgi:hypothetical protein